MATKQSHNRRGQSPQRARRGKRPAATVFSRTNYILLLAGLAVIVLGYVIMRMDNEIDGFLSLYIAPIMILGGYLEIIYAISYQPKTESDPDPS